MNALKYHWCEASLLPQPACLHVLKNVVSQDFIFKTLCKGLILYLAKTETYGIAPYKNC